jgi:hypothetical protein
MELYLSKTHADEDGPMAVDGKLAIIRCSKNDVQHLADFFNDICEDLKNTDKCHLHFRDHLKNWSKDKHIDIQVDVGQ